MKHLVITLAIMASLLTLSPVHAKRDHFEKLYQNQWCQEQKGETEVQMPDRTRCDCITGTHAIEMDFGDKWYQAVTQSLHYSLQADKRAGILLILESPDDRKYWEKLRRVINHYKLPIDVWTIGNGTTPNLSFTKGWENNGKKPETSLNCNKAATLNIKRRGTSTTWVIHIPCLIDSAGAFQGKTPWLILESKQNVGEDIFSITKYGFVEQ